MFQTRHDRRPSDWQSLYLIHSAATTPDGIRISRFVRWNQAPEARLIMMSKEQHSNIRDTRHTDTRALEPCDLTAPNIEVHPVNQPNELYSTRDQAGFFCFCFYTHQRCKTTPAVSTLADPPAVNSVDTFSKLCLPCSRARSLHPSLHLSLFQARGCLQDCLHWDIFGCLEMTNTLHARKILFTLLLIFSLSLSLPFFFFACTSCWIAQVGASRRQVYLKFAENLSLFLQEYQWSTLGISQSEQTAWNNKRWSHRGNITRPIWWAGGGWWMQGGWAALWLGNNNVTYIPLTIMRCSDHKVESRQRAWRDGPVFASTAARIWGKPASVVMLRRK